MKAARDDVDNLVRLKSALRGIEMRQPHHPGRTDIQLKSALRGIEI